MQTNADKLNEALAIVLDDHEFMGDSKKVNKLLEAMEIKNDVTKLLKQACGYGVKYWALDFAKGKSTNEERTEKVRSHILGTDAYKRFMTVPASGDPGVIAKAQKAKEDAERWMAEQFLIVLKTFDD